MVSHNPNDTGTLLHSHSYPDRFYFNIQQYEYLHGEPTSVTFLSDDVASDDDHKQSVVETLKSSANVKKRDTATFFFNSVPVDKWWESFNVTWTKSFPLRDCEFGMSRYTVFFINRPDSKRRYAPLMRPYFDWQCGEQSLCGITAEENCLNPVTGLSDDRRRHIEREMHIKSRLLGFFF